MTHTLDTKAQIAAGTSDPQTTSYTCGSGATLLVVTLIYAEGTRTGNVTYNDVALTQADQTRYPASGSEARCELWYMVDPPTGSAYDIDVPNPNGLSLEVCISSYKAGTGYTSVYKTATGSQSNWGDWPRTGNQTPDKNGAVYVAVCCSGMDTHGTYNKLGTNLYETDNGTWGGSHQYYLQSTAAAAEMFWWLNSAEDWAMVSAVFDVLVLPDTGINVTKANVYSTLEPKKGIGASKAVVQSVLESGGKGVKVGKSNVYGVLFTYPQGLINAKSNVYSNLEPAKGVSVAKALVYSVLSEEPPPPEGLYFVVPANTQAYLFVMCDSAKDKFDIKKFVYDYQN